MKNLLLIALLFTILSSEVCNKDPKPIRDHKAPVPRAYTASNTPNSVPLNAGIGALLAVGIVLGIVLLKKSSNLKHV